MQLFNIVCTLAISAIWGTKTICQKGRFWSGTYQL